MKEEVLGKVGIGFLVLFVLQIVAGDDFYISTTGADGDGCGQTDTPCATLNFTLTLATNGDTIYFKEGEYVNQPNVTIALDSLSFIGQGNVTFNGVGTYENSTLFYITGDNLSFTNLQFSYFFVNSVIHTIPLFLIQLTDTGTFNFTNISYSNGKNIVIATTANATEQHSGQITITSFNVKKSTLISFVMSNLPLQMNQVIIDNCTAYNQFVNVVLSQKDVPAVTSFVNSAIINNSHGTFIGYYGPYSGNDNVGGDDTVTFTNFTASDLYGSLGYLYGSNVILTSSSSNNVAISSNYQAFITQFYVVSLEVSDCVFDGFYYSTNAGLNSGNIVEIRYVVNSTRSSILFDSITISNSAQVNLNDGLFDSSITLADITYSNLNFINVTESSILSILSPSSVVENIYFYKCTGGPLRSYTGSVLQQFNSSFNNITIADSTCSEYCVYFSVNSNSIPPLSAFAVNNVTLTNVQSASTPGVGVFYVFSIAGGLTFSVNDYSASNVTGFADTFWYAGVNFTVGGSFEYDNVQINGSVTPVFSCGLTSQTFLVVSTSLGLPLSDLFPSDATCTASYLGFTLVSNNSTNLGPYDPASHTPFAWIAFSGCVALFAVVVAGCFIIYKRTTKAYTTIDG